MDVKRIEEPTNKSLGGRNRVGVLARSALAIRGWTTVLLIGATMQVRGQAPLGTDNPWEKLPDGTLGRLENFDGVSGVKIAGYVRKPAGEGPFPIVIILHGSGPIARKVQADMEEAKREKMAVEAARAGKVMGRSTHPPIPEFLAQGWAVYTIDYRPNPRYMIDPLEFEDTVIAVNKAKAFAFVDSKRVAMFGGSHGGHVTGRMLSRVELCCAVLCAPAGLDLLELSHLAEKGVSIGGNRGLIRQLETRTGVKMHEIEKNPEAYHYSSLLTEAAEVRCPLLLISGCNDPNAPRPLMDLYVGKLRAAGKKAETYHPENGPHGFYVGLPQTIPETAESTRRAVEFIKEWFEKAGR